MRKIQTALLSLSVAFAACAALALAAGFAFIPLWALGGF